jgi:hypothetical protein
MILLDIKGLRLTGGDYQAASESLPLRHKNNGLQQQAVALLFVWSIYAPNMYQKK